MNVVGRCAKAAALRHGHQSLQLLQIEIDARHAPIVAKVALHHAQEQVDDSPIARKPIGDLHAAQHPHRALAPDTLDTLDGGPDLHGSIGQPRTGADLARQIHNNAGANGAIASEYVARAAPDGYTLMFGYIATHGINPALQKLKYDPVADFEAIGMVAASPTVLVVNNDVAAKNVKELVQLMKAKPGAFSYASAGNGTAPHIAGELFKLSAGLDVVSIPYKGSAPAVVDTIAGNTQLMFPSLFTAYPQVKGGKLKALGVSTRQRSPLAPEVPTIAEAGVKGYEMTYWFAAYAPAGTPADVVAKLSDMLARAARSSSAAPFYQASGTEIFTSSPEELRKFQAAETLKWGRIIKGAGIEPE